MVWLKTSDDFSEDCADAGLSDAAYRTHHEGLCWTMRRLTDGHVRADAVRRFAGTQKPAAAIEELVRVGFWTEHESGDGWQIEHHMEHQPRRRQVVKQRAAARKRMAALRAKQREEAGE